MYAFYDCIHAQSLSERLQKKFQNDILSSLKPQAVILGLTNEPINTYNQLNHIYWFLNIAMIIKYYVYISREKHILNVDVV